MRTKKIRGYKRRIRSIENWKNKNLKLHFNLLEEYNYVNADIVVHPWCDISIIKSVIPEPKGKARQEIIKGLIDIYVSWKSQLDKLETPYYLSIWLYEQRLSKSEVVCAINDKVDYYENLFFEPEKNKKRFKPENFGNISNQFSMFDWSYRFDEDHFDDKFVGELEMYSTEEDYLEAKKWFSKKITKPHRLGKFDSSEYDFSELYSFKRGDLWIGKIK